METLKNTSGMIFIRPLLLLLLLLQTFINGTSDWGSTAAAAARWPRDGTSINSKGKLTNLDVICGKDHMTVRAEFDGPFDGIVSSKGTWGQDNCVYIRSHSGVTHSTFKVMYNECGTKPDLQGKYYENTIVIQYGTDIIEAMDEAKRLRCEWFEAYEKPATFRPAIPVADLDVVEMNFQGDDIDCWMEIQEGKGPWAREVSRIVPVGQPMTIVIAIQDQSNQFDMRVKSCFAHDGVNPPVQLTDQYGCVLRKSMLSEFMKVKGDEYYAGLAKISGGTGSSLQPVGNYVHKASVLSYAHFYAFKFPDSMSVQIQCTVEVCRNGCPNACERGYYPPPTRILQPKVSIHQAAPVENAERPNRHNHVGSDAYRHASPLHHHVYVDKEDNPVESGEEEMSMTAAESSVEPIRVPMENHLNDAEESAPAASPLINQLMNLTAASASSTSNEEEIRSDKSNNSPVYRPNAEEDEESTDAPESDQSRFANSEEYSSSSESVSQKPDGNDSEMKSDDISSNEPKVSELSTSTPSLPKAVHLQPIKNEMRNGELQKDSKVASPAVAQNVRLPVRPITPHMNIPIQRIPLPIPASLLSGYTRQDEQQLHMLLQNPDSLNQFLNSALNSAPSFAAPVQLMPQPAPQTASRNPLSHFSPTAAGQKLAAAILKHSPLPISLMQHLQKHRSSLLPSSILGNGFSSGPRSFRNRRSLNKPIVESEVIGKRASESTRKRRSTGSQVHLQKQFQVVTSMDMEFNPNAELDQPALLQGHLPNSRSGSVCFEFASALTMLLMGGGIFGIICLAAFLSIQRINRLQKK